MEQLYIDGQPIVYDENPIYSGEEANIHRYREDMLIKVFKKERRKYSSSSARIISVLIKIYDAILLFAMLLSI